MAEIKGVRASLQDIQAAMPDLTRCWLSRKTTGADPVAASIFDNGGTMGDVAYVFGATMMEAEGRTPKSRQQAVGKAMATPDFGIRIAQGLQEYVWNRLATTNEHREICAPVQAMDFKSIEFPEIELDDPIPPVVNEGAKIPVVAAKHRPGLVQRVVRRISNLLVTEEVVLADEWDLVEGTLAAMVDGVIRAEHKAVMEAMEDAGDMVDGDPLFSTEAGNVVPGKPFGPDGVGAGMAALRKQKVSGEPANLTARWLVVPPDHEREAMQIVRDITTGNDPAMRIMVTPELPGSRFYMLADWRQSAAVHFLTLDNDRRRQSSMDVESISRKTLPVEYDGMAFRVGAQFSALASSRTGIVRVDGEE